MNAKFLSLGLTAILATPIIVVSNPQQAQALCNGSSCNGQDPGTSGCSTDPNHPSRTVATTSDRVTMVELRRSDLCNSNWVRATTIPGSTLYIQEAPAQGNKKHVQFTTSVNGTSWTDMWDGNVPNERACVDRPLLPTICTSYVK